MAADERSTRRDAAEPLGEGGYRRLGSLPDNYLEWIRTVSGCQAVIYHCDSLQQHVLPGGHDQI